MTDYDLIRRCDVLEILDNEGSLGRTRKLVEQLVTVTPEAQAAEIERLETYRKKTYEGLLEVTRIHDEVEAKLEKMIGGAETVLEAWDSGNEASFRDAIEEMRADVEEAKGDKP